MVVDLRVGGTWRTTGKSVMVRPSSSRVSTPPSNRTIFSNTPGATIGTADPNKRSARYELTEHEDGSTVLRVRHSGFTNVQSRDNHSEGWNRVLGWLTNFVEDLYLSRGGHDGVARRGSHHGRGSAHAAFQRRRKRGAQRNDLGALPVRRLELHVVRNSIRVFAIMVSVFVLLCAFTVWYVGGLDRATRLLLRPMFALLLAFVAMALGQLFSSSPRPASAHPACLLAAICDTPIIGS